MGRLTVEEAARRLKRHPELVRKWLRAGTLRGARTGEGTRAVWTVDERELSRFRRNEPERRQRRS